jgi:hypothetical protein
METPVKDKDSSIETGISAAPTGVSSPGGSSVGNQTLTIEHAVNTDGGRDGARSAGLIMGMSKPRLCMVAGFLLLVGGLAYFFSGWLGIPGLNNQIDRLEAEVNRLSTEVDRLEAENDRYESLNDNLNITVQDFQELNEQLNSTTNRLETINKQLNATNREFSQRIDDLMQENEEYASLNSGLNATTVELSSQLLRFQTAIADLILENAALINVSDELTNLTSSLQGVSQDQNVTLLALELTLTEIALENDRLEGVNSDLSTIVSFFNETSTGLDDSLQQVTEFLAGQISTNRILVLDSLENAYRQRVSNWDCDYREVFREMDYGADFDLLIPESDWSSVVSYVDTRVLQELCLNDSDFNQYLQDTYPSGLTSNRFITAITIYTTEALDWYFPETEEDGISPSEWADARYQCENLPTPFEYSFVVKIRNVL